MLLVTGATGRLGRILRAAWTRPDVIWQARQPVPGFHAWDMLTEDWPGASLADGVILNLAGVTPGPGRDLGQNLTLAQAALRARARHVFLVSSAAVYGPGASVNLAEDAPRHPANPYAVAKVEMEAAAANLPGVTILRIGNVAGSDALIGGAVPGRTVTLDPVPGSDCGPVRSYIGPLTLAAVMARLADLALEGAALPKVLNIAAPRAVGMANLLEAAEIKWSFGDENPNVVARVVLDTTELQRFFSFAPDAGTAKTMIAEWRALQDIAK